MSEWRPEGWENPYFTQERYDECEGAYEDGADAMLAALRESAKKAPWREWLHLWYPLTFYVSDGDNG
ncbi:hypothetical protein LCGC14_1137660 [marine sediment metagenome]|uniref:Uncharacterized protein n=1 Tax=marine sediment metagenome TaxID=412755 RepID=A0A0F9LZC9_9ZZZZ